MRSRALNLAALALLFGIFEWIGAGERPAAAQQLDAGKPPAQIFAGTCSACHKSPRGLVRNVSPGSLPGFLRQHYTTGNDMAGTMATFVLGNGGTQQVAEPPPAQKREPKQKAKSDTPEVAARPPETKELPKSAKQQKAGKKGQPEPAAKDTPGVEAEKPDSSKSEPAAEPAKPETAAVDCKVEDPSKQAASGEIPPASNLSPPRQPAALLTLPGFPAPVPDPEPEPAARPGCEPSTGTPAVARVEAPAKEAAKEMPAEASREAGRQPPKEQPVPAAPPAVVEAPKNEPAQQTVTEAAAPVLDIMREEVHAPPAPARQPKQQKKQ